MKKFIVGMMMAVMLLSGCANNSAGNSESADRPKKSTVYKDKEQKFFSEKEPVRAVKINGFLYYETGEDRDADAVCANLDGSFTKTVDYYEIPQNDNESNFDLIDKDYCGYRFGMSEDTIEIPIGDDCEIFKKIYDPQKDVMQYKYIMKLDGQTEYSFGEAEYIVLTNDKDITANDVAKSMFSSRSEDILDIYIVSFEKD